MSSGVIQLEQARNQQAWKQFHARCKSNAGSRASYHKYFEESKAHVFNRAADQNSTLRNAIQSMHVAAIIREGVLFESTCNPKSVEIVILGTLIDFQYVEFGTASGVTAIKTIAQLIVRVVIRELKNKALVVTIHPETTEFSFPIPEVDYENIW
jgi:hypothetical protein